MSPAIANTRSELASSFSAARRLSSLREQMQTFAPASRSALLIANPIPLLLAVTSAVLPTRLIIIRVNIRQDLQDLNRLTRILLILLNPANHYQKLPPPHTDS